jgi:Ca-activated chloride channel family protein
MMAAAGLVAVASPVPANERESCDAAMLVFDASASMRGERLAEAKAAVHRVVPALARQRRVGLVSYGGTFAASRCGTVELRFGPRAGAADAILSYVEAVQPSGPTPLSAAVARAAQVLAGQANSGTIVLVTDGEENCGGDPCALADEIAGLPTRITVHVIGYRQRIAPGSKLACLAERTGGFAVEVADAEGLSKALDDTLGCRAVSQRRRVLASLSGWR